MRFCVHPLKMDSLFVPVLRAPTVKPIDLEREILRVLIVPVPHPWAGEPVEESELPLLWDNLCYNYSPACGLPTWRL